MGRILFSLVMVLGIAALTPGQTPGTARAEVLVLGVYHMANPGHDIFNTQADDVLAPKRQTEMAALTEVLKRFRPTKIAVERNAGDERIAHDYADYLAGKHQLTRNEIEQIGFRLAKEMGHKSVYPVDADGGFPYQRLVNYAKATNHSKELEAIMNTFGEQVKADNSFLASHTILEMLLRMNSDEAAATNLGGYARLARFGEPGDWAGADLVSDWFRRNMRISSNVMQLIESPNERVLVIFGSGHLPWLRNNFANDPDLRLRKLAEFAK